MNIHIHTYVFSPSRFGLVMTFAHEKKKPTHPNTRTQTLRVFCKHRSHTDQEEGGTGAVQSECYYYQFPLSFWNKNILTHGARQRQPPPSLAECDCLRDPPSAVFVGTTQPFRLFPCPSSQGTRKGDHDDMEAAVLDSGWWCHSGQRGAWSQGQPGRPLQREAELISHFMHTHASFAHWKNRPMQSKGSILAWSCKNQMDFSFLATTLALTYFLVLVVPAWRMKRYRAKCFWKALKQNSVHSHKEKWALVH